MRAFVLGGGGSFGAMQVGALRSLLRNQIRPDMLVGCSVGALNAGVMAREMSAEQVEKLAGIWRDTHIANVYPGGRVQSVWRFLTGQDSFYDNRAFYAHIRRHLCSLATTFAHVTGVKLFVTATHVGSGELHVFGDRPGDRLLDSVMASTALTPLFPPWAVDGERFMDGGTISSLPLRVALERGATEIFALDLVKAPDEGEAKPLRGVTSMIYHSVNTMLRLQVKHDLLLAEIARRVKLHYIALEAPSGMTSLDFEQPERLIAAGESAADRYLTEHNLLATPRRPLAMPWRANRKAAGEMMPADEAQPAV
jgi:NTE family protein